MTTVRVPVRVRVEVAEDRLDGDLVGLVGDAVDAAVGRAVDRALGVHAVTRAPRPGPACTSVRFTGDPLPRRVAAALEARLLAGLEVAAARLRTAADAVGTAPGTDGRDTGERLDHERVVSDEGGHDGYRVPYYDRAGDPVDVRLHGLPADPASPPPPPAAERLRRFATGQELWAAIMARTRGAPPAELVAIHAAFHGHGAVAEFVDSDPSGRARIVAQVPLSVYVYPGGRRQATLAPVGFVRADRWSRYGEASGREQVRALLTEVLMLDLARQSPGARYEDLQHLAAERIKELPDLRDARSLTIYQLTYGDEVVWIGPVLHPVPFGERPVLVFTEDDPEDTGEDTYGRDCPPLEDAGSWLAALGLLHDDPGTPENAFLGEPAIVNWPATIAARLEPQVKAIAGTLHMEPGAYVGGFLIAAMAHIDRSCRRLVSTHSPLGPQIQRMAGVFGPVRTLFQEYVTVMLAQDDAKALPCPVAGQSRTWVLRFTEVYASARDDAVASMFVSTCQDVLLQVLFATQHELSKRAQNFPAYMPIARLLLTVMLSDTVELMALRESLIDREKQAFAESVAAGYVLGPSVGSTWLALTGTLVDSLTEEPVSRDPAAGTVVLHRDGYRVYDGKGQWWSRAELDSLISAQRQQVSAVDPLLDKVSEVDDLVRELKAAQVLDAGASTVAGHQLTAHVDKVFSDLIADLLKENRRFLEKAAADRTLAFGLANFTRADVRSASDIGATLSGIHKLADDRLRPQFTDAEAYVAGMSRLAAVEIGKAELSEILNLVGVTVLAIFCPPLALAVGVVQAYEGLATAFEHRDLQRAMLDGDEILSKAQVEAEMWAAVIGAALTVIPELPSVARGARGVTRALVKGEVTEAAAAATRAAMRDIVKHLAELSIEHFTTRFVRELTQAYLINLALSKAMNRIAEAVARQVGVTGHASVFDVLDVLGSAIAGPPPPPGGAP